MPDTTHSLEALEDSAVLLTVAIMVALAYLVERLVLRPLVNQEGVALLMAMLEAGGCEPG